MDVIHAYKEDFSRLVDVAYLTYHGDYPEVEDSYSRRLRDMLLPLIEESPPCRPLSREDIYQTLAEIWLSLAQNTDRNTRMGMRVYLLSLSIFKLRDRILAELKLAPYIPSVELEDETPFKLDVKFLIKGTDWHPLCLLTPYERYLIFLKFTEEKTIVEVAKITQQTRQTVSTHLKGILEKLRRVEHGLGNT